MTADFSMETVSQKAMEWLTVVPLYSWGVYSKTPSGFLEQSIILNLYILYFFYTYIPIVKFNL